MREKKHIPPSRKRYEKRNPNWTVRMPLLWHKEYEKYVAKFGLSRKDFMSIALEKIKLDYEQIQIQAYNEGFENGHKQGYTEGYSNGENIGYNKGHQVGFEEAKQVGLDLGKNEWAIWGNCIICGRPIYIKPLSEEHDMIIDLFIDRGLAHMECADNM